MGKVWSGARVAQKDMPSMKVLIVILIIIPVVIGAGILYIYSGYYNIAATQSHTKITVGVINEVRDASVPKEIVYRINLKPLKI